MLEDVSEGYQQALLEMALGSFIAHADGELVEAEHLRLVELATTAPVANHQERKRLHANRFWFETIKPDMSMLRKRLKSASAEDALILRAAAIAMAHADMAIVPEEVAGIEKIYMALGLDRSLVYADLHARDVIDVPISVRAAVAEAGGESIPDDPQSNAVTLDMSKIAQIRSNTNRVSSVLGDIFGADAEGDNTDTAAAPDNGFKGLDTIHSAFVQELIAKDSWSADELAVIAAANKLPMSGMIETVNEWSFELHGEMLIDDYDGYEIIPEIAEAIRHSLNGGK
jgi:tellurite resistance protein